MNKNRRLILSLSFLSLFLIITLFYEIDLFANFDNSVNSYFSNSDNNLFFYISLFLHYAFDFWTLLVLTIFISIFIYFKKYKKFSFFFLTSMIIGPGIYYLVKILIARERPINFIENGFSFPSGHVINSILFLGLIFYFILNNKISYKKDFFYLLFFTIVLLIGISRLYLSVHWFSDILGGFAFGGFLLYFFIFVYESLVK